ncbi:MAG: hypothetical protein JKX84_06340 [Flavobacteriales bacterium]|nr:hypothetical protein [Flavobacteriales bacterium]
MVFIKKHLSTILISLFIGVLLFYVQPVLEYIRIKTVSFFISISDKFSEAYYSNIAKNDPNTFEEYNSSFLFMAFLIFVLAGISHLLLRREELKSSISDTILNIQETKKRIENKDGGSKNKVGPDINELEKSAQKLKERIYKRDNLLISIAILGLFSVLLLFSNYVWNKSIASDNLKFRNRITILLPHIGINKAHEMNAHWAQMKTKEDFQVIINEIDSLEIHYETKLFTK